MRNPKCSGEAAISLDCTEQLMQHDHQKISIDRNGGIFCGRLNMSASGLVEADVWMQTPGNSFQPSAFWQKVQTVGVHAQGLRGVHRAASQGSALRDWVLQSVPILTP